ncbi:MAG: RNA-binding S4 domain-containing protein [Bacteroidales bacterium]|nr:RNA-binding S4 domain-containing protein [Bacteroidales bacterium]
MEKEAGIRIDKWLWAVRLYKTRSLATEACKKGRILINNMQVKPSRLIREGEEVVVRKLPAIYSFKIVKAIEKRVSAKLAMEAYENLTPEEEIAKLTALNETLFIKRDRGTGRPTKKERRLLDKLTNEE